jgi:hypothetical protein
MLCIALIVAAILLHLTPKYLITTNAVIVAVFLVIPLYCLYLLKMKLSSLKSAIQDYQRITGETVSNYNYTEYVNGMFFNPTTNKYMIVLPSNEFAIFAIGEREGLSYLHLDQIYGFMKNLAPLLLDIMNVTNLTKIVTLTQRNPKYHCRKWKMEHAKERDFKANDKDYHVLIGDIDGLKESLKWEV